MYQSVLLAGKDFTNFYRLYVSDLIGRSAANKYNPVAATDKQVTVQRITAKIRDAY